MTVARAAGPHSYVSCLRKGTPGRRVASPAILEEAAHPQRERSVSAHARRAQDKHDLPETRRLRHGAETAISMSRDSLDDHLVTGQVKNKKNQSYYNENPDDNPEAVSPNPQLIQL